MNEITERLKAQTIHRMALRMAEANARLSIAETTVLARICLEEIREPTDEMVDAADNAYYYYSEGINVSELIDRDGIRSMLRAAVSVALNEKSPDDRGAAGRKINRD